MANRRTKKLSKSEVRSLGDDLFPWPWKPLAGSAESGQVALPRAIQEGTILPADPRASLLTLIVSVNADYAMTAFERSIFAYVITSPKKSGESREMVFPVCSDGIADYREVKRSGDSITEVVGFVWTGERWDPRWTTLAAPASTDWESYAKGRRAIERAVYEILRGLYGEDQAG